MPYDKNMDIAKKHVGIIMAAFMSVPFVSHAATITSLQGFATTLVDLINKGVVPLLMGVALVQFLWGLAGLLSDSKKKDEAKERMIWGIVGLFVMVSVWGIVNLLVNSFNLGNTQVTIPKF